jgi:DNA-binding transcriptional ArsR family regulator
MDIFTALSVPTRRAIVEILAKKGNLNATDIYDKFDSSPPAISQHLKVLLGAKIVYVKKQGQHRIYQLNIEKMYEFEKWAHNIGIVWNQRFNRLDKVLEEEKKKLPTNK